MSSFFRARNYELFFKGFNPKAWWKIGQIGDDGYERPLGVYLGPALANLAVKVRNHGNQEIRRLFPPELFEQIYQGPVEQADGRLKDT